jgi:hypothetical protein
MIHGIYVRNRPKAKWHLVSVAISAEAAVYELEVMLKQAKQEGHERAEVAVQVFDSMLWMPETLTQVKDQKPMYN